MYSSAFWSSAASTSEVPGVSAFAKNACLAAPVVMITTLLQQTYNYHKGLTCA